MVVVLSGLFWSVFGRDRVEGEAHQVIGRLAELTLPEAEAPERRQRRAIHRIAEALDIELALMGNDQKLIAATSNPRRFKGNFDKRDGWHFRRGHVLWTYNLTDGRVLIADFRDRAPRFRLVSFALYLGIIALAVAIGAYPLVRRLTRRLENLQLGVEQVGKGDLTARVPVEGRDEVANLASSFNEAAQKIERLVDGHRLLLANASHELRTPLSRIRLGIDMLKEGKDDPKRMAQLTSDISELDMLIDEILLMSRLDAGEEANITQSVDLLALAAEECARYENCDLDGVSAEVPGDMRLLRRLLRNLLENAYKHGKPPVSVTISVRGQNAYLTVADHGNGIAETDKETVFRPFYRGSGNQNIKGYGLGLPLVRQIAEAHRGSVEIASTNFGTKIVTTLPLHHNEKKGA